ncbi:hypothetical protein MPSEU_001080100 [Mayamaea pseudoterrestris]|nr:hypothetical protein MPSEU_001080100 [Mayamaea pseudoterrestris]
MSSSSSKTVVPWSSVWATLVTSSVIGFALHCVFTVMRRYQKSHGHHMPYETRQHRVAHRSPPPYEGNAWWGLALAAYRIDNDEALRCMGLDMYMFCRMLRLGFRVAVFGSIVGVIFLIPIYATGTRTGPDTEEFNSITAATIEQAGNRLWASAIAFSAFCAYTMHLLYSEWKNEYAPRRLHYLVHGMEGTDDDYRYAAIIENVPSHLQSNHRLRAYMERLFPGDIRQVYVVQDTKVLDALVKERQTAIEELEKATAHIHAKPNKPAPKAKQGAKMCGLGGTKVEAVPFYEGEIERLNREIDEERAKAIALADKNNELAAQGSSRVSFKGSQRGNNESKSVDLTDQDSQTEQDDSAPLPVSTAFVTFRSMRAKQEAVQCELSEKVNFLDCDNAPVPKDIHWENIPFPVKKQGLYRTLAAGMWIVLALFWSFPMAVVSGLSNLNSLLQTIGIPPLDPNSFYYGLISGLLPVILLQVFMALLYKALEMCALKFIHEKSMAQVDAYALFWYQIFQFANLWLIIIGGSAFNQLNALFENPSSIATLLAAALPGATTFFVNLVITGSFLYYGLELSQATYWVKDAIMKCIRPEPSQTQRMLDERKKPQSIEFGKKVPAIIFIFLLTFTYMAIVPILEVFAAVYFGIWYLVWKHQCLHVYSQEFETGGLIWEKISAFILVCLYMAEFIMCAYLGLKEAGGPAIFTAIVALVGTMIAHHQLRKNVAGPLMNVSLETAAEFDEKRGELKGDGNDTLESLAYAQPCLKASEDERKPMPYRRGEGEDSDEEAQGSDTVVGDATSVDLFPAEASYHTARGSETQGSGFFESSEALLLDENDAVLRVDDDEAKHYDDDNALLFGEDELKRPRENV